MTDIEKVRICEIISLAQRVLDNARGDLIERRTEAANAKLELLNLELGIYKKDYEDEEENKETPDMSMPPTPPMTMPESPIIDSEPVAAEVIE